MKRTIKREKKTRAKEKRPQKRPRKPEFKFRKYSVNDEIAYGSMISSDDYHAIMQDVKKHEKSLAKHLKDFSKTVKTDKEFNPEGFVKYLNKLGHKNLGRVIGEAVETERDVVAFGETEIGGMWENYLEESFSDKDRPELNSSDEIFSHAEDLELHEERMKEEEEEEDDDDQH